MNLMYKIAKELKDSGEADYFSKHLSYFENYCEFFEKIRLEPLNILEIGTADAVGIRVFSEFFPNSKIVGVDIAPKKVDLGPKYSNVKIFTCSQTDGPNLENIINSELDGAIDIVIDDASHFGIHSKIAYEIVFPFIKAQGYYVLEDWGTGYNPSWYDGSGYVQPHYDGNRIISHDYGLVGFAKSLVDQVENETTVTSYDHKLTKPVKSVDFRFGMVFLKKW